MSQLAAALDQLRNQRVALIGVPIDYHCSYKRGPALAPPIIRAALKCEAVNLWTESGLCLQSEDSVIDLGDMDLPEVETAFALVRSQFDLLLKNNLKPLTIGGDHAITYAILCAVRAKYPRLTVIQIDAHPDLHQEFLGDKYSHASVFARVMEENLCDRLIQIGLRTFDDHQCQQAKRFRTEVIPMKDLGTRDPGPFHTPVYISFDLDGLDPAFAPGVSHREPGGMTTRQAINLLHSLEAEVVGADLVEYNPECDLQNITAATAAKLLKELAAVMLAPANKREA